MNSESATSESTEIDLSENKNDRLFRIAMIGSVCFLFTMFGMMMAVWKAAPYCWTENAVQAFNALRSQQKMFAEQYPSTLWQPARYDGLNHETNAANFARSGYTLYASGENSTAHLVDFTGKEVHCWDAPFSKICKSRSLAKSFIPDNRIMIRRGQVFPNGDLLALYETPLNTPNGMGLARLDRNSQVIWSYNGNCHHDFALADDGTIFVLTHELKPSDHPKNILEHQTNIEDFLTIVSKNGVEQKSFSLLNAFYDSPFYRQFILQREQSGDLLHANTVNLINKEFAAKHKQISEGDLMICFRNLNLVVAINPDTEKIVWGSSGPWHFPHDPDPLPNGNILIFDNCVCTELEAHSRVIEFDPVTKQVVWSYAGNRELRLRSDIRSTQQRLNNGNTLICESDGGRMVEVNTAREVVWQFVNPVRGQDAAGRYVPIMTSVRRYEAGDLPFLSQRRMVVNRDK